MVPCQWSSSSGLSLGSKTIKMNTESSRRILTKSRVPLGETPQQRFQPHIEFGDKMIALENELKTELAVVYTEEAEFVKTFNLEFGKVSRRVDKIRELRQHTRDERCPGLFKWVIEKFRTKRELDDIAPPKDLLDVRKAEFKERRRVIRRDYDARRNTLRELYRRRKGKKTDKEPSLCHW